MTSTASGVDGAETELDGWQLNDAAQAAQSAAAGGGEH